MPRFPLIVFDMDGVLVDSVPCHARAYRDCGR
jgi:beta-phosphoglucomutase-like phosphatase (HAD superfamily)